MDSFLTNFIGDAPASLWVGLLVFSYLVGSIPFGLFLCQHLGFGDIRLQGSRNIGATNILRICGKKPAALILFLDSLKGAVPVLVAYMILPGLAALCGFIAILGHIFPVWLKFKGGKGVATALGVFLALAWPIGLLVCVLWISLAVAFRYSSAAALISFATAPTLFHFLAPEHTLIVFFITLAVWIRHYTNIQRLIAGTESRIGNKKVPEE